MRLFHFSEDPAIEVFEPRPVRIPSARPEGKEWLNGPLVWAIDEDHQPMYLFPRDCPRILIWPTSHSSAEDIALFWTGAPRGKIAFIERSWLERVKTARLYRYEAPVEAFNPLDDAGMHVSRVAVRPISVQTIADLPAALAECGTELRVVDDLVPLRGLWEGSLHVSGLRLRNAKGWA